MHEDHPFSFCLLTKKAISTQAEAETIQHHDDETFVPNDGKGGQLAAPARAPRLHTTHEHESLLLKQSLPV